MYGATKTIDNSGLIAGGRAWDLQAHPVGVANGAFIAEGRSGTDAFDGGLTFLFGGTGFTDQDGKGTFDPKTNSFSTGPDGIGPVKISRTDTAAGPYLRTLVKVKNPGALGTITPIGWDSNLGSDSDETTQASSSGDKNYTAADRWLVSSASGANGFGDDPTLGFALYGKGAKEKVDTVVDGPGSGVLDVTFENVNIKPHSTSYFLFYTEMHANPKLAKKAMKKYDSRHLSKGLLKGIGKKTRKNILNWNL